MVKFNSIIHEFPEALQPESKDNPVVWTFVGDPTTIEYIKPGCGCTASIEQVGNSIRAMFTETIVGDGKDLAKSGKKWDSGFITFKKRVTVYFKDGPAVFTMTGGSKLWNKNKKQIDIFIKGKVDIASIKAKVSVRRKKYLN